MTDIVRIEGSVLHDTEWFLTQNGAALDLSTYSTPTIKVWAEGSTTLAFTAKTTGITLNASPTLITATSPVASVTIAWTTSDLGALTATGGVQTRYRGIFSAVLGGKTLKIPFSIAIDDDPSV